VVKDQLAPALDSRDEGNVGISGIRDIDINAIFLDLTDLENI
jgi:hypothetical protein